MILRSIELESFGRFRGQTVEFRRGLNLVIGPNEAGKTTLAEAVPAVLFGTNRLERFKPWGRNLCSAALFFEGRGHTVEVKRNLLTDEVELVEKDDLYHVRSQFSGKAPLRGRSASCREYRELLEKLIGVADEKLFRATYFFGHHPQTWSGDELALKLRTLVSGTAEADYADILDKLLEEHFDLTRSNPWGRDKQRDREYEIVCRQLAEQGDGTTVPVFVEIDKSEAEEPQADLEAEIQNLAEELEFERGEYQKGQRYVERFRQRTTGNREAPASAEDAEAVKSDTETVKSMAPDAKGALAEKLTAVGLPSNPPRQLPELLAEASEIRQQLAALQQPFSILHSREKKIPQSPWLIIGCLLVLFAVLAGVAWWQPFFKTPLLAVAGAGTVALLAWVAWRQFARKKSLQQCRKERGPLEQKKAAAQQRQAELSERCEALGLPTSAVDMVRLQKLVMTHQALLDQYWSTSAAGSDDAADEDSVETVNHASSAPESTESAVSEEAREDDEDGAELRQLETRLTEFSASLTEKEARLQALQVKLKSSRQSAQGGAEGQSGKLVPQRDPLVQELSVKSPTSPLQRRKYELENRISILRKSINLLAAAVDEFTRSHLVKLNAEAGKMFGKMTEGRYTAIRLDENMAPSVQVDGRRWTPVDHFSRGTVDAIYLALRMALAKVRDDGRSLPLMLDDPFVHLDQKRLAKTLNLIDLASADGQLIVFSHNLELGKRAARERWHVVPLDGDAVDTTPDEGGEHAGQLHLL